MADLLEQSYFEKRLAALGIDPTHRDWCVEVYNPDAEYPMPETALFPIFTEDDKGNIRILVYDIEQNLINYTKAGDGKMSQVNAKVKHFYITRLKEPFTNKQGDKIKYLLPKGVGTYPFFPPKLTAKFKAKEKITTLVLTEGYFKAAKASAHGLDIVGLSSITHLTDIKTGELHYDIQRLIVNCQVENVIWLVDGDCLNLSAAAITDGDLYKRPAGFFQSANKFKDLVSKFEVKRYFAHVNSEAFPPEISNEVKIYPKGLDDALVSLPHKASDIINDLIDVSAKPHYFTRFDITFNIGKLHKYFNLANVTEFYLAYADAYPDLKDKEFKWNGTKYRYNSERNECEVIIPAEASKYFRVGDQYHEWVEVPNKYGDKEIRFERRMKGTISDDHGKNIFRHIPKYQAFCNVPDHTNFQPVINNCFNVYQRFEHEPEQGDFPNTEKFLRHIFGHGSVHWKDPKTGEKMEISEYDLGLDYVSLLYQKPTQILPILCLVSRENNTGKSTFAQWLKLIFTQNVAIIGNAELVDNFNASWATKLIIACDETKIDKQEVIEKVKRLSTADKVFMNAKGKDHVELDFFGKFIFLSNNEENFIYASEDDVRYWIRKIKPITDLNVNMMEDLRNEIPAFLHFLNERKIKTPRRHRGWFDPELIKTDALKKVIQYSMPTIEKELRTKIISMFKDFGLKEIKMSLTDIRQEFFKNRFEDNYIEETLKKRLKVKPVHRIKYQNKTWDHIEDFEKEHPNVPEADGTNDGYVLTNLVIRYKLPTWDYIPGEGGKQDFARVDKARHGRPYVFRAKDFLSEKELEQIDYDAEIKHTNGILNDDTQTSLPLPDTKLPF